MPDLLHAFDLVLLHSASRWNLENREGRKASATWLKGVYARVLREALKPEVFWELGAHNADFSCKLKAALPNLICHAFEANPYNYEKYNQQVREAGVSYHHLALGPANGEATFKIGRRLDDRELQPDVGCNSILTKSGDRDYEDATVQMVSVDSFSEEHGLTDRSCAFWIDTEGFAYQVLQGMLNTLRNSYCVFVEVEDRELWEEQKTYVDVRSFLFAQGFIPVLRDFEFKQQYNVLFARPEFLDRADVRLILTTSLQLTS